MGVFNHYYLMRFEVVRGEFMEKRTIAQAAIEVLKEAKQPMPAAEITQAILDKGLYNFKAKAPKAMASGAGK
jgi:hypothetical protein